MGLRLGPCVFLGTFGQRPTGHLPAAGTFWNIDRAPGSYKRGVKISSDVGHLNVLPTNWPSSRRNPAGHLTHQPGAGSNLGQVNLSIYLPGAVFAPAKRWLCPIRGLADPGARPASVEYTSQRQITTAHASQSIVKFF